MRSIPPAICKTLACTAALLGAASIVAAQQADSLHITHQYADVDARSMIGLPMGNHKTIVTQDGQLEWSQWSLARKGRAVLFGFSEQLDGALGIHLSELDGGTAKPLKAKGQRLDQMRFPFVITDWKGDSLSAQETAFASSAGQGLDVVLLTVANSSNQPRTMELRLNGKQRNLPAFASGAQLATRDGNLLAAVEPANGVSSQSTADDGLTLVQQRTVPANGSISFWIKLPYEQPDSEKQPVTAADAPTLLADARSAWQKLWGEGTQIELPAHERELSDFYQASVAYILMLTERDENGELWTLDGPALYREFWGRGEYFQGRSIEFAGYLGIGQDTVKHTFSLQKDDGEWDWPVTSGWPAWDNIGGNAASVWDYYLLTRDKQWLASSYPHLAAAADWINLHREESMVPEDAPDATRPIHRQIPWSCTPETSPSLKPGEKPYWYGLLPWSYGDSGLPEGHPFPHNTWGLYAIKIAENAANILGKPEDAARFAANYADYKKAYFTAMQRSIGLEKGDPDAPYLPAMPTEPGADVSQSLIAVYPTDLLKPDNLWVTNLLSRMRRDELEGLPTHMAWMGAGGVWPSESMNVAETYLRLGNIEKTVSLLMATLNHTYTTDTFREEIKVDKTKPLACASGQSKDVPNGYGTGDMPEAWGPANLILLLRDMLFYEDGGSLHILSGIPSDWIHPGEKLAISSAPTTLGGKVSLALDYPQAGRMRLHIAPSVNVPEAIVRFPLTAGATLRSVTANGQPVTGFTGDSVTLKNITGPVDLEAQF
ncbi:MAG TPA: hypothetical protein VHD85_21260 [Terracidiphilus sp.]|nr:hypothetical protein [Terracidiphilus sp.]